MESAGSELNVNSLISRLKQFYDVIPESTPGINRDKFNESLMDAHELISDSEKKHTNRLHEKVNEFRLFKKEQELKIRDWKDRYDKLFYRWREVLRQLDRIQKESEKVRSERDRLLLSQTTQKDFKTFENETEKRKRERRRLRKYFIEEILFELLNQVTDVFNCQMGSVFVGTKHRRFLTTLVCINNIVTKEEQLNVKIEIPSTKGIAGYVFRHREAVNVLNPYQDKRFYRKVDKELGTTTKVLLCFPLIESLSEETMGVIQVLNKKDDVQFSLRDEERMEEFAGLFSVLLESSSWLFKHEYKSDPYGMGVSSARSKGSQASGRRRSGRLGGGRSGRVGGKGQGIQVTRIGKDTSMSDLGEMKNIRSLVPKKVEDFVVKLNQCWKRAVKQCSDLQNENSLMQKDLQYLEKNVVVLKSEVRGYQKELEESIERYRKQMEDFKSKRKDWVNERKKLKDQLKRVEEKIAHLAHPSKASLGLTGLRKMRTRGKPRHQSPQNNRMRTRSQRYSMGSTSYHRQTSRMPHIHLTPQGRRFQRNRKKKREEEEEGEEKEGESDKKKNILQAEEKDLRKRHSVANPEKLKDNINIQPKKSVSPSSGRKASIYNISGRFNRSMDHISLLPRFPDIFELTFRHAPCAMLLLSHKYRIWRVNEKFGEMMGNIEEHDLIGTLFSEIAVGVDVESLPKLLKFDVVQGLGISIPVTNVKKKRLLEFEKKNKSENSKKISNDGSGEVIKVTMQISVIGIEGSKMMNINRKVVKAPMYNLVFYKIKK